MIQMGADTLSDSTKGSATPDQGRSSLIGSQRVDRQDVKANKGVGVLDLPGDLAASRQASGTTWGTSGERTGVQESMLEVPEIFAGQQTETC